VLGSVSVKPKKVSIVMFLMMSNMIWRHNTFDVKIKRHFRTWQHGGVVCFCVSVDRAAFNMVSEVGWAHHPHTGYPAGDGWTYNKYTYMRSYLNTLQLPIQKWLHIALNTNNCHIMSFSFVDAC
jgi:hypothetical protein